LFRFLIIPPSASEACRAAALSRRGNISDLSAVALATEPSRRR
jgi:hypothetical protein